MPEKHGKVFKFLTSLLAYLLIAIWGLVMLAIAIPLIIGAGYLLVWAIPFLTGVVLVLTHLEVIFLVRF